MIDMPAYCVGCIYRRGSRGETSCDYILMTGVRRPCPAGEGCTAKKTEGSKKEIEIYDLRTAYEGEEAAGGPWY